MRQSSGLNYQGESYPVWLYDMSIVDVNKRREQRRLFPKAIAAANFLGIPPGKFYEIVGGSQRYAYHKTTGNKYAVRKAKCN